MKKITQRFLLTLAMCVGVCVSAFAQASLPFNFDGGANDIKDVEGLTSENIGADYKDSPKLRFENKTGNGLLILNFTGAPEELSYSIKWNGSGTFGKFTVSVSENGTDYTVIKTYENGDLKSNAVLKEKVAIDNKSVRYIKWYYDEKASGNIGLGAISLTAGVAEDVVEAPVFDVVGALNGYEKYIEKATVELTSATEGSKIYYNINSGEVPSATSTEYTAPIPVTESSTIKAIAIKDGKSSTVITREISVDANDVVTLPYLQKFDGSLADWYPCSINGEQVWAAASYQETTYAKISGYLSGSRFENEDWLISPAIPAGKIVVNFESAQNKESDGTGIGFAYSFDYDGYSDPTTASWTFVTEGITWSPVGETYAITPSGDIEIDNTTENPTHIAYKYTSSNEVANTWQIYNVSIDKKETVSVETETVSDIDVYTANGNIYIKGADGKNVNIYNMQGQEIKAFKADAESVVPVVKGIYIIKVDGKAVKVIL